MVDRSQESLASGQSTVHQSCPGITTSHRASTSTRWHLAFGTICICSA